jgi:hypothetical protein
MPCICSEMAEDDRGVSRPASPIKSLVVRNYVDGGRPSIVGFILLMCWNLNPWRTFMHGVIACTS